MARIRTVKPDFFRHEGLQDLEVSHPGSYPMLVFSGLWGHCDKSGRFEWKPRSLKLDILPFLPFDMGTTLDLLETHGYLRSYEHSGKKYGEIPSFPSHQRISGKESQEPVKYPDPPWATVGNQPGSGGEAPQEHLGSTGEASGIAGREGKGKEEEGKGERAAARATKRPGEDYSPDDAVRAWVAEQGYASYIDLHIEKFRAACATQRRPAYKSLDAAFRNCVLDDWGGVRRQAKDAERRGERRPRVGEVGKPKIAVYAESSDGKRGLIAEYDGGADLDNAKLAIRDYSGRPFVRNARNIVVRSGSSESRFSLSELRQ